jgi:dipeptidyl aminopeptidase/acylaminoacyl peptidase
VLEPLVFMPDGGHLIVAAERRDDSLDLFQYDIRAGRITRTLHEIAGLDLGVMRFSAVTGAPAQIDIPASRPSQVLLNDDWARWQTALDRRFPDTWNHIESVGQGDRQAIVLTSSDRDPGEYWLLDTNNLEPRSLGKRMPQVDPASMQATRAIRFTSRDGHTMHGYWTPPQAGGRDAPAVLYVHGGPWTRDQWGFDPMVQWLSANGLGVLQVNFRGSRGFGRDWLMSGQGEWGGRMQDDLEDAVRQAAERRLLDSARVCIIGGSYGGYAALMGVLTAPQLFRCAVSQAGVTDPGGQVRAFEAQGNLRAAAEWRSMVGTPAELDMHSPRSMAKQLTRPVLLIHGDRDHTVPADGSRSFAALAGEQVQLLILNGEGHRIHAPKARLKWFVATTDFVRSALGMPGPGRSGGPKE